MSMRNAEASNWVAERAEATTTAFVLKGSSKSYTSFSRAFSGGDTVFYSAHDEQGNREAGYGVFDGSTVISRNPTATLVDNVYSSSIPAKVNFSGEVTVACTFNAVAFNTLWKALDAIDPDGDGGINIPPELINGLIDSLNSKAEQSDLEKEIQDRIDGDKALQDQIDALDPDGDRTVDWNEIEGKPTEFPPSAHQQGWDTITGKPADYPPSSHGHAWDEITGKPTEFPPSAHNHDGVYAPVVHGHEIDDINGLQDALDASGGTPAWDDVTGKPAEFPPEAHTQGWDTITGKPAEYPPEAHTHQQGDVDGLEDRLTSIEGSISSGGGFVDAPNDGRLYGRQSEAWAEVVVPDAADPDWSDIQNKPTEFPPTTHNHAWDEITGKPADYPPSTHGHEIAEIDGLADALTNAGAPTAWDDVTGKPTEFPPAAHNHGWGDITGKPTEFPPESHNHVVADITDFDPDDYQPKGDYQPAGEYIGEAPDDGKQYARRSKAWSEIVIPDGGTGSSVHIGENPPADPQEGQQWMEVPASGDATMWIYDGGKWLQQPGGKDGAPGADGNIADGTSNGIVATWDSTANGGQGQWTPDSTVVVSGNNVGIGVAPSQKLDVGGVLQVRATATSSGSDGDTNATAMRCLDGGGTKWSNARYYAFAHEFYSGGNATNSANKRLTIDASGNVGIGTSDPAKPLAVSNSSDKTVEVEPLNDNNRIISFDRDNGVYHPLRVDALEFNFTTGPLGGQNSSSLLINQQGDATFSNEVAVSDTKITESGKIWQEGHCGIRMSTVGGSGPDTLCMIPLSSAGTAQLNTGFMDIGRVNYPFKDAYFSGTVNSTNTRSQRVIQDGSPVIDAKGLIKTLSTLRNATKDETTLEGLRDAIGNAIGGLIEEFENQIAEMPAEVEE